jgi:hypothetical protein
MNCTRALRGLPSRSINSTKEVQKMTDELIQLSANQSDCYRAIPEDFEIMRDGDPAFHGQDSTRLRKQRAKDHGKSKLTGTAPRATSVNDAGAPRTEGIDGAEGA